MTFVTDGQTGRLIDDSTGSTGDMDNVVLQDRINEQKPPKVGVTAEVSFVGLLDGFMVDFGEGWKGGAASQEKG